MHVLVHVIDPADRDHVVLKAGGEVQLRKFDHIAMDMVDATDVLAVGADDFEVFADGGRVYHGVLRTTGMSGENRPARRRLHRGGRMGDVVNLNRVRKDRAKAAARATAAANRAAHGRTKAERAQTEAESARTARLLDGAKREDTDDLA